MSEPDQKPSQSSAVIDEEERCEKQMEETILQIDINAERESNCVGDEPEDSKGDKRKNNAAEAFKEKIEAMIEKVSLIERFKVSIDANIPTF